MIRMALIKLSLILCALMAVAVFGKSCEKVAYALMSSCSGSTNVIQCVENVEPTLTYCPNPKQLLGLADKTEHHTSWSEMSCEAKAKALTLSCHYSITKPQCLQTAQSEMVGCTNAAELLVWDPDEWSDLNCEDEAFAIKIFCTSANDIEKCYREKKHLMNGCENADTLLGLEGTEFDDSLWVHPTCDKKAETIKFNCSGSKNKNQCLRSKLSEMSGCENANQLLGITEEQEVGGAEE